MHSCSLLPPTPSGSSSFDVSSADRAEMVLGLVERLNRYEPRRCPPINGGFDA
jgi:hypothetical protein